MSLTELQIPTQLDQSLAVADAAIASVKEACKDLPPDRLYPLDQQLTPEQQDLQNFWESFLTHLDNDPNKRAQNQERRHQRDKDFLATHSGHPRSTIASRIAKYGEHHPITICKRLYKQINYYRQTLRKLLASPNPDPQKVTYYQQRIADLLHQRELNNEARRKLSDHRYRDNHAHLPPKPEPAPYIAPTSIDDAGFTDDLED